MKGYFLIINPLSFQRAIACLRERQSTSSSRLKTTAVKHETNAHLLSLTNIDTNTSILSIKFPYFSYYFIYCSQSKRYAIKTS
jgi:hypothetical protein